MHLPQDKLTDIAQKIANITPENKVMICGNGGDAALSNHFATDLMKFAGVPAVSLCADQSLMTMIANDYGYEEVFAWQIRRAGAKGDILICLSTSGLSKNILAAARAACPGDFRRWMDIISIMGENGNGGELRDMSDVAVIIPKLNHPMPIEDVQSAICHMITIDVAMARGVWDC